MGFGTVVANIIMFITVLILATGVISVFKTVIDDSTNSMREQGERMSQQIDTDLEITSAVYNATTEDTTVYATNIGDTELRLEYIDVYVDGGFVPRNTSARTIEVRPSTHIRNSGVLDPNEVLEVVVLDRPLETTETHTVSISTEYGTRTEETISMP